jgi:hypothetical protein
MHIEIVLIIIMHSVVIAFVRRSFTVARYKGWLVESDTAYGARGKVEGGDICVSVIRFS